MLGAECKHRQLARSCNLCCAAESVKEAFMEGYSKGFDRANYSEPQYNHENEDYESSDAKINADAI